VSVYAYVYTERERISVTLVTTSAQGVPARAHGWRYFFANLSTVSMCLLVHTVTHTHTQATLKTQANTCQVLIENQHFHSSTVSQYSVTRNTHTHRSDESPSKMFGGRSDNWLLDKTSHLYQGETESQATSCKVHSEKQSIYIYIDMHRHTIMDVGKYDCLRNESESASHSSPPQLKGVRVISTSASAHACVCWYYFSNLSAVSVCLPVHNATQKHTRTHKTTYCQVYSKIKQTNMTTCVSVYVYGYAERERISVALVTTAAQGCASDV
jgi:hypothetical protein